MQSNFLELDNPAFDLGALKRQIPHNTPTLLTATLRESLVIQPPMAPNERLPRSFIILDDHPALSSHPLPNYSYKADIALNIHPKHELMYEMVQTELTDTLFRTTHGTTQTLRQGCNGPLCRRIRNINRYQTARLREARTNSRRPCSYFELMADRFDSLRRRQPIYAAVEPLLEAMTIWAHQSRPPKDPTETSKRYLNLGINRDITRMFLKKLYGDMIEMS